jgi:hypothetical protein
MTKREARKIAREAIAREIVSRMASEIPQFIIDEHGEDSPICAVYQEECFRAARLVCPQT